MVGLGGTVTFKVASSVPMRSTLPLAIQRSVLDSINSESVSINWNLMEELPQFKTRIFIVHPRPFIRGTMQAQTNLPHPQGKIVSYCAVMIFYNFKLAKRKICMC